MKEDIERIKRAVQNAEREKEQALKDRDIAGRRQNEARKAAEETERRSVETAKRMEQALQTAERGGNSSKKREMRQVAETERLKAKEAEAEAKELGTQWVVGRREIQLTDVELGRGGWGAVSVANCNFRGIQVAAKCLYKDLSSSYY